MFEDPVMYFKLNEGKRFYNYKAKDYLRKSPVYVKGFGYNGTSIAQLNHREKLEKQINATLKKIGTGGSPMQKQFL